MIRGKNINLRLLLEEDLKEIYELDADVYSRGPHFPMDLRSMVSLKDGFAKDGIWGPERGCMLIVDALDDRKLGKIFYFKTVSYYNALEIGYILFRPEDRGKGAMTEAVQLFSKYLFDCKSISRLQIQVEPGNIGSRRVAEKCGYIFEGTARSAFVSRGVECDLNVFSLTLADLGREQ